MSVPGAAVAALLRLDALREPLTRELGAVARRLEGAAPRARPLGRWLFAHRRELAAGASVLAGLFLVAAGGGLV